MNFNLNEEQRMLVDSLDRVVAENFSADARPAVGAQAPAADGWRILADMGVIGLTVPDEFGGMGKGPVETYLVMRALGKGLLPYPVVPSAVVASGILLRGGSGTQKARWLEAMTAGALRIALALDEPDTHHELSDIRTRLTGGKLSGTKSVVLGGATADRLLVAARGESDGIALCCIDARSPGVHIDDFPTIDGQRCAEIAFDNVAVPSEDLVGDERTGEELLEWGLDHGRAAQCAEAVGAMERLFAMTLDYLKTRTQFGQPLGRFQALQHRAVDMLVTLEQAQSAALQAAADVGDPNVRTRQKAVSAGKALIGRQGRLIGEQAVQLFGGMGMTDEFDAGRIFKRLLALDLTWGDSNYHTRRYASLMR